jgi:hypothetical protein
MSESWKPRVGRFGVRGVIEAEADKVSALLELS